MLVDPSSRFHILCQEAQDHAVAYTGLTLLYGDEGNLVSLRDILQQCDIKPFQTLAFSGIGDDDRNIIRFVNFNSSHRFALCQNY